MKFRRPGSAGPFLCGGPKPWQKLQKANSKILIPSQWRIHIKNCYISIQNPKSYWKAWTLDFGISIFGIWDLGGDRRLASVRVSAAGLFINVCKAAVPSNAESHSPVAIAIVGRFVCRRPPRHTTKKTELWRLKGGAHLLKFNQTMLQKVVFFDRNHCTEAL